VESHTPIRTTTAVSIHHHLLRFSPFPNRVFGFSDPCSRFSRERKSTPLGERKKWWTDAEGFSRGGKTERFSFSLCCLKFGGIWGFLFSVCGVSLFYFS